MSLRKELSNIDSTSTSTYSSSATNKVKFYMIERLGRIIDEGEDNKNLFIPDVEHVSNVDEVYKIYDKPLMTHRSIQANFLNSPLSSRSVSSRTNSFNNYNRKK
jgi:hypothetical protein